MATNRYPVLPIIGEDIAQIGQVISVLQSPCAPNATIIVQAAFHALPYLLLSLTKPEILDIDMPGNKHRGRKKRRGIFKITDILQPTLVIRGMPSWVKFTFNNVERLGWYMLVIDATTDFAVNWASMAWRWSGCKVPNEPYCTSTNVFQVFRHGVWTRPALENIHNGPFGIAGNTGGITVQPGVKSSFEFGMLTGRDRHYPGRYNTTSIRWRLNRGGTTVDETDPFPPDDPEGNIHSGGVFQDWAIAAAGGQWTLEFNAEGPTTFGRGYNQEFNAYGQSISGLEPDP